MKSNKTPFELYPIMYSSNSNADEFMKCFLSVLLRYADKNTLESYPSRETIMQHMPSTNGTFYRTRNKLVSIGLITLNGKIYSIDYNKFIKYFACAHNEAAGKQLPSCVKKVTPLVKKITTLVKKDTALCSKDYHTGKKDYHTGKKDYHTGKKDYHTGNAIKDEQTKEQTKEQTNEQTRRKTRAAVLQPQLLVSKPDILDSKQLNKYIPPNQSPPKPPAKPPAKASAKLPAKSVTDTTLVFNAYVIGYKFKYNIEPIRNAKVNSQLKQLVQRIGLQNSIDLAQAFCGHTNSFYARCGHSIPTMLKDCESLVTQLRTGKIINSDNLYIDKKEEHRDNAFKQAAYESGIHDYEELKANPERLKAMYKAAYAKT